MRAPEFEAHAMWTTLDQIVQQLDDDLHLPDEETREAAREVQSQVEYIEALRNIDPYLVQPEGPRDLQNSLTQTHNYLTNYKADPDGYRHYLSTAAQQTHSILNIVRSYFPFPHADEATAAAKGAATRYKNSLDAEVARLHATIDDLTDQLARGVTERETAKAEADQRLAEFEQKVSASQEEVDALTLKLNRQIDGQRTTFEEEAAQRATTFRTSEKDRQDAEEERAAAADKAAADARDEQETAALEALQQLETYKDQAASLANLTSRHAITGDYGSWATRQARAALAWTVATVVIGLGTVAGLLYAVNTVSDDSIQFTVYKGGISLIGLIVAGYTARQAAEHRREERTAKRLALDLAALEPFLVNVDNPTELRTEIARRVFVPETGDRSDSNTELRTRRGRLSVRELTDLVAAFQRPPGV